MRIDTVKFSKLEKELAKTHKSHLDYLAPEIGKVYIVAITRDGCSVCEKQKPKLNNLATVITEKHGAGAVFTRIHIRYSNGSEEESLRSKDVLGHYFYPTNLILFRTTDRGAIEYYRNAAPEIDELEKNIKTALEVATMFEKETA